MRSSGSRSGSNRWLLTSASALRKRTCTFVPVTMHGLQRMHRDRNACRAKRWMTGSERGLSTDSVRGSIAQGGGWIVPAVNTNLGYLTRIHGGIFSRAEALDCGETDRTLAEARRAGVDRSPSARHVRARRHLSGVRRLRQASTACARGVGSSERPRALTGASAAALHGFALYQQDLSIVHILRLDQGASRRKALTNHHIVIKDLDSELGQYDGFSVSPARAVWEVACRSTMEAGVVAADSAFGRRPS